MISRNYTWLDENIEHSEEEELRAAALAKKWSQIQGELERDAFSKQVRYESGDYGPEPCGECEACLNDDDGKCEFIKNVTKQMDATLLDKELELEIIEEKLERLGARMMRAYEHWNEDERYMEWMERDRD